jgi:hypothetical protein
MNGEQPTNEILRAIGSLESSVTALTKTITDNQEDLKHIRLTCQRFEDYREARKDLPDKIAVIQSIIADYPADKAKIAFLIERYKAILAFGVALYALMGLVGFALSRGWLKWGW